MADSPALPSEFNPHFLETEDIRDLHTLQTYEDRLVFLSERPPKVPLLSSEERNDTCKVAGCISGLWITGRQRNNAWEFQTYSESNIVLGVASLLCDLFYGATSEEILAITDEEISALAIEQLLSLNRRHAVGKIIDFFRSCAREDVHLR